MFGAFGVLAAIKFDDKTSGHTCEVSHIVSKRDLSAESEPLKLFPP